jgi:peptidoglycan/xylan/chitin deacetylase (PgdA/CDA1 family)
MSWWWAAAAGLGAAAFSARYHWWRPRLAGAPVLMYHQIREDLEDTPLPKLRVRPKKFAAQLAALERRGYRVVSLGRALGPDPPAKAAVLTFDDAYADFAHNAWPLLKERDMGATVFVVTGQIGGVNAWDQGKGIPPAPLLDAESIRDLAAQGVEFGGHGHTHRDLTGLNDAELAAELAACRDALAGLLGAPPRVFSYPYGRYDDRVKRAVAAAGFSAACGIRPGLLGAASDPLALGRIIVKRSDGALDFTLKLTRARSRW